MVLLEQGKRLPKLGELDALTRITVQGLVERV
jgi:hypothetical protein